MRFGPVSRVLRSRTWTGTHTNTHTHTHTEWILICPNSHLWAWMQFPLNVSQCRWMTETPPSLPSISPPLCCETTPPPHLTVCLIYDSNSLVQTQTQAILPTIQYIPVLVPLSLSSALSLSHTHTNPNLASGDWLSQQFCLVCFWSFWYLISVSSNSATCTRWRGEERFGKEMPARHLRAFWHRISLSIDKQLDEKSEGQTRTRSGSSWTLRLRLQPDVIMSSDWNQKRIWTHLTSTKIKTKPKGSHWGSAAPVPGLSTGSEIQTPSLETSRRHSNLNVHFPSQGLYIISLFFFKRWSKNSLSNKFSLVFLWGNCLNVNTECWQCCHIAFLLQL